MARTFADQDILLLGYTEVARRTDADTFVIYDARAPGLRAKRAVFVYLKSSATHDSVKEAVEACKGTSEAYVVVPKALETRKSGYKSLFPASTLIYVHDDLIWDHVRRIFGTYLDALQHQLPNVEFYVTPRPAKAADERLDNISIEFLVGDGASEPENIMAILAAAGIGKTTLAREVTRQLARSADRNRRIPIYVEGSHWARLVDTFDDLWSVIGNSIHHFDPTLPITLDLFRHLLRSGDLAFVFDGFDELCSFGRGSFNANEMLVELDQLAKESSAKILLTSRTLYWEAEIGQSEVAVLKEHLSPFSKPQAYAYFGKRLGEGSQLQKKAIDLFETIRNQNQPTSGSLEKQLPYHPFVVDMVATAVQSGVNSLSQPKGVGSEMFQIIISFCEREAHRQGLVTGAEYQLDAFEYLSIEGYKEFTKDDLAAVGFDKADTPKLAVHPLLQVGSKAEVFKFKYDFLPPLLRARFLVRNLLSLCEGVSQLSDSALQIMQNEAAGRGFLMDHVLNMWPEGKPVSMLASISDALPTQDTKAKSFVFHLAKGLVNRENPSGSREDRTLELFGALSGTSAKSDKQVSNISVEGVIEKLDLSGWCISSAVFSNVVFKDCVVDQSTIFDRCIFNGDVEIVGVGRGDWSNIRRLNCTANPAAELAFSNAQASGKIADSKAADRAIELALSKFWKGGRIQRSVAKVHWHKGPLARHELSGVVLNAMLKAGVIEEKDTSGVTEGVYILAQDAIGDLQRFMDNKQKSGKVALVYSLIHD